MPIFSFLFLRPLKSPKFWILDIKVCLKKLGIGSGLHGKNVLYLRVNFIYRNPCDKTFLTFVVECCIFAVLSQLVTCVVTLRKVLRETNCRFSSMLFPASSNAAQAIQAAKDELGKGSSYDKMGCQVSKCGVQNLIV